MAKVSNLAISLLQPTMKTLCLRAKHLVNEAYVVGQPDHCEICNKLAEEFELWDRANTFPVWLSRVVEGIIRDSEHSEFTV